MKDGLVIRNSPWKLLLSLLLCLAIIFVVVLGPETFGLRPKPGWQWVGWPAALFFGGIGILVSRQIFDRAPELVISPGGIFWRHWSDETIPWGAIRECSIDRIEPGWLTFKRLVRLDLYEPKAHPRTRWRFFGSRWNMGHGDIPIITSGLDHEVEDIWEAIERFAAPDVALDGSKLGEGVGPRRKRG